LHNSVDTIYRTAEDLQQMLPNLSIGVAHGQMRERELEKVMVDFYHNRYNVLLCTTIIETGIDVPNANTIIIDRADKLGLAQLHQLRGRVGRSHHQAYAYLLTPAFKSLTADAKKRLDALSSADSLGAGFMLASHDLEIRGAGELLGEEQSGNMQTIGFTLYMELLERTVKALKSGKTLNLEKSFVPEGTEVDLRISALLPDDYVPDIQMRLSFYQRIAHSQTQAELDDIQVELIDRFGLLPESAHNLFACAALRLKAQVLGIKKLEAHAHGGRVEFFEQPNINPLTIIKLIQVAAKTYQLNGPNKLSIKAEIPQAKDRIAQMQTLIEKLSK
jgi:transcription-repair coupling factor (superfamily II helicase)